MQNWLVVRQVVKCSTAVVIQHQGSEISLVSKDDCEDLKTFLPFYLVGIMKEFVNWHLGSRDLTKYHSQYGKEH